MKLSEVSIAMEAFPTRLGIGRLHVWSSGFGVIKRLLEAVSFVRPAWVQTVCLCLYWRLCEMVGEDCPVLEVA